MIFTHPALRLLARRKFRGFWRAQLRRFRSPAGAIFALIGIGAFGLWLFSAWLGPMVARHPSSDTQFLGAAGEALLFAGAVLTVIGAFSHRGLYVPKEEIDLLLSAPVSRSDLVRYRLLSTLVRSMLGGLFVGFAIAPRADSALFGFLGAWLYVMTLPVLGQLVSLVAGQFEHRLTSRAARAASGALAVVSAVLIGLIVFAMFAGDTIARALQRTGGGATFVDVMNSRWIEALGAPFTPWSRAIGATGWIEFVYWAAVCVVIWVGLFELCARVPIDFRELSLSTAADVAKRLNRVRRGGGAANSAVSRVAIGWRVPWLFGKGPFGAIAWRKAGSIVRKARGTIVTSVLVVLFITLIPSGFGRDSDPWTAPLVIATIGTIYLAAGLRFDFRDDLERMDVIKSWPVAPWRVFLATLLPETVLVAALIVGAIVLRGAIVGALHAGLLIFVVAVPLAVFLWVALDNAVFLLAPVRYVPGQEGALQHAGRAMVLMALRLVLAAIGLAAAAVPAIVMSAASLWGVDFPTWLVVAVALGGGLLIGAAELAALVWAGGRMLARFDVARDRG